MIDDYVREEWLEEFELGRRVQSHLLVENTLTTAARTVAIEYRLIFGTDSQARIDVQ